MCVCAYLLCKRTKLGRHGPASSLPLPLPSASVHREREERWLNEASKLSAEYNPVTPIAERLE